MPDGMSFGRQYTVAPDIKGTGEGPLKAFTSKGYIFKKKRFIESLSEAQT